MFNYYNSVRLHFKYKHLHFKLKISNLNYCKIQNKKQSFNYLYIMICVSTLQNITMNQSYFFIRWMEKEGQWILRYHNRKIGRWPADQRKRTYRTKAYIQVKLFFIKIFIIYLVLGHISIYLKNKTLITSDITSHVLSLRM